MTAKPTDPADTADLSDVTDESVPSLALLEGVAPGPHPLGIDIGGSGIKGAPVDLGAGRFATERMKVLTPQPATPGAVADAVATIVEHFEPVCDGQPIGITVPGVVLDGVVRFAPNIDPSWVGCDAATLFSKRLGHAVTLVNDADAAGYGELHFGAGKGHRGLVIMTTLGTGIGTALINDGVLVRNCELGHIEVDGTDAETQASAAVREREDLSWKAWAKRLQRYYSTMEALFWPQLFIVGGGVSRKADKFLPLLDLTTEIVPGQLRNDAGIIGAALLAVQEARAKPQG